MEGALQEFQKAIEAQTKPAVTEILRGNFSTTGLIEQFCSQIALMETCQKFFKYQCYTLCGLTKIHLLGTLEDWQLLKKKLESLKQFDCDWWIKELEIVIEQFIETYNEKVDYDFWDKIFTYQGATSGSGAKNASIGGWFMAFYPYINKKKNYWFVDKGCKVEITDFQDNCLNVPFELDQTPCVLMAGFSGIYQLENNFRPQLSAAVATTTSSSSSKKKTQLAKNV